MGFLSPVIFCKNALVPGASGIIRRTLIEHLLSLDDWNIVGLSRRKPEFDSRAKFIEVNLLDRADCEQKLGGLRDITHIFYAGYVPATNPTQEVAPNKAMLVNVVEAVKSASSSLQHVLRWNLTKPKVAVKNDYSSNLTDHPYTASFVLCKFFPCLRRHL